VDGNTASWGVSHKLESGSPVLWIESRNNYREHFYAHLLPWKHYIPISVDASDLRAAKIWVSENDEEARRIAENAHRLFKTRLRAQDLHCYVFRLLHSIASGQVDARQNAIPKYIRENLGEALFEQFLLYRASTVT
jgi:hypothetical protein